MSRSARPSCSKRARAVRESTGTTTLDGADRPPRRHLEGAPLPLLPTKHRFFEAALEQAAAEVAARTEPDPSLSPVEQLSGSLDGFLGWIEENATAYKKLMESATSVPEVRDMITTVRDQTSARIIDGLHPDGPAPPKVRAAVRGWLWFMDGVILDWLDGDTEREELRNFLLGSLLGALTVAGSTPAAA